MYNVAILNKFDNNGVFNFSFKKYVFANKLLTLMLVYRKQLLRMKRFSQMSHSNVPISASNN